MAAPSPPPPSGPAADRDEPDETSPHAARVEQVLARIDAMRREKKLSQDALGAAVGKTNAWMNRVLTGGHRLRLQSLFELAEALGEPLPALLGLPEGPRDEHEAALLGAFRQLDARGRADVLTIAAALAAARRGDDPLLALIEGLSEEERERFGRMAEAAFLPRRKPSGDDLA